ncbi:beta-N-acetylhexosaminidase [Rhizobiaceae bacterium]|nr:beta-N-acetylhexosaminidase [Rhizobiaceae bacterium]
MFKPFTIGILGLSLTPEERDFIAAERPWGFVLFARNIDTPDQVRSLTAELREASGRDDVAVLIDQEGGRVQRLRPPHWARYVAGAALGEVHARDPKKGERAAWLQGRLHALDLAALGINVDCLPVLDVPVPGGHDAIGDRALGTDPTVVTALGRASIDGLLAGGVVPVMKHIPGHGRSTLDSHHDLPTVDEPLETLRKTDFAPFAALQDTPMAMTAHIVFPAIDPDHPATTSAKLIKTIIRGELGFDGLLLSDDVGMKALKGDHAERARAIIAAGCDIVLECNGTMDQRRAVASVLEEASDVCIARAAKAMAHVGKSVACDEQTCRDELADLLGQTAIA